jgi:dienelactone hydrolase
MEKKIVLIIFYCVTFVSLTFFKVSAQQIFKTTNTSTIAYLEYVPEDYSVNSNKYPVVIFLHGIGERGANSTDPALLAGTIWNVAKHGPPKHVKAGFKFPFILISPQLKNNNGSWPSNYVMEVIEHCKTYLRIDERRIYLTGLSLGGGGTWWAAQDYPEFFAAIAPVCGGYNSTSKACGIANADLPVWAFHGDKDNVVPYSKSVNMVNAINSCIPQTSVLAKMTMYPGVAHNAWDYAYVPDNSLHTPNVYQWLMTYTNIYNNNNRIPIADAGDDRTIGATSLTIVGSGTDVDGSIASYSWTKVSGPLATMANPNSNTLSLSNLPLGDYLFKLRVTDNSNNTDSDYVKIKVVEPTNTAPKAMAGADKTITLPINSITITGSASDSDGSIASYTWSKTSGPNTPVFTNANTATLSATGLIQGTYVLRLTVKDNAGASHYDEMILKVNAAAGPVVNAGTDKLVTLASASTRMGGIASGTIISYNWTKISGPTCVLSYQNTNSLKVSALVSGSYVFRLTATDSNGLTGSDDVTLTVDAAPVANAGADRTIKLPATYPVTLNGTASDVDGTISQYLWSKYSGPNFQADRLTTTTPTLKIINLYAGTYVFKFAVTDNLGITVFDYVTITVPSATTTSVSR